MAFSIRDASLLGDRVPSRWQQEALAALAAHGGSGTVKAVTGSGKTVLALAALEDAFRRGDATHGVIVVPTIALMNQWRSDIIKYGNLPAGAVGRIGGGHTDAFGHRVRLIVAVLDSARKCLPEMVARANVGAGLFMVADECHRTGSPSNLRIYETPRRYTLGISATPERDDANGAPYEHSPLGRAIGRIVYELSFAQALDWGILPEFTMHHLGLPLTEEEGAEHARMSRIIKECRRNLLGALPEAADKIGGELLAFVAARTGGNQDMMRLAHAIVNNTRDRQTLVWQADNRLEATRRLVNQALADRQSARIIMFHERIDEARLIFDALSADGVAVALENSKLKGRERAAALESFRAGDVQVLVSCKSLVEGFNVPECDLGLIVASNASPRQRIQSIGRVLRRGDTPDKRSKVVILYMRGTNDERIYEKLDWDELMGPGRNEYYAWDLDDGAPPVRLERAPREFAPEVEAPESDALAGLSVGDPYPGKYAGLEFISDTQGRVKNRAKVYALNPQGIPTVIQKIKGSVGRFRVDPDSRAIIALKKVDDGWLVVYGGILPEPFRFPGEEAQAAAPALAQPTPSRPVAERPAPKPASVPARRAAVAADPGSLAAMLDIAEQVGRMMASRR